MKLAEGERTFNRTARRAPLNLLDKRGHFGAQISAGDDSVPFLTKAAWTIDTDRRQERGLSFPMFLLLLEELPTDPVQ